MTLIHTSSYIQKCIIVVFLCCKTSLYISDLDVILLHQLIYYLFFLIFIAAKVTCVCHNGYDYK